MEVLPVPSPDQVNTACGLRLRNFYRVWNGSRAIETNTLERDYFPYFTIFAREKRVYFQLPDPWVWLVDVYTVGEGLLDRLVGLAVLWDVESHTLRVAGRLNTVEIVIGSEFHVVLCAVLATDAIRSGAFSQSPV